MPVPLALTRTGRVALVTPSGELDLAEAPALRRALQEGVRAGAVLVVVDLHDVPFVDSSVLGVLLEAHKALEAVGERRLLLVNAQGLPLRVLQLTGLDRVLHVAGADARLQDDGLRTAPA